VEGPEECADKAEALGRKFFNFDEERKLCFTSLTCNDQQRTARRWQIYELAGPSPTPSPTRSTPNPTPSSLRWMPVKEPKMKCERAAGAVNKQVADLAACQKEAESQGQVYLNFEPQRLLCFTSETCNDPKTTTYDWQIYNLREPPTKWIAMLRPKQKCERPAGEKPEQVADLAACEQRAEAQGRKFINFESDRKVCFTSLTCNRPVRAAGYVWRVYRQVEAASSSQDDEVMVMSTSFNAVFDPIFDPYRKCERPAGESPVTATLAECQAKATAEFRSFFTFHSAQSLCFTSPTCNDPAPSVFAWQVYAAGGLEALSQ
jgi:hypothetical protein